MKLILIYLIEVSVCQSILYMLYRSLFLRFTFFRLNRFYLSAAVVLSFIIPALHVEVYEPQMSSFNPISLISQISEYNKTVESTTELNQSNQAINWEALSFSALFAVYGIGLLYLLFGFVRGILSLSRNIRENTVIIRNGNKVIETHIGPPFYSFLDYIFINIKSRQLSPPEIDLALKHEEFHIRLGHTYDLLLLEFARMVCWFNPVMHWIKRTAIENHEYEVDSLMNDMGKDMYSNLILKLSLKKDAIPMTSQFSMKDMKKRVNHIYQSNTNTMKKLFYLLTIPVVGILVSLFSFTEKNVDHAIASKSNSESEGWTIGNVVWNGNTLYSDDYLTGFMKIKKGSPYDESKVNELINYSPDGSDIGSLYMDKGYLFFLIDYAVEHVGENQVNLTFDINEGEVFKIDEMSFEGFPKETDYSKIIPIKSGEIFNRLLLIKSQEKLSKSVNKEIAVQPMPNLEENKVDIKFTIMTDTNSSK